MKNRYPNISKNPELMLLDMIIAEMLRAFLRNILNKKKPFGAKGKDKEFPDAFVLTSLEAFAKDKHIRHIIILSKDADMNEYESKVFTPYNAADFF